MDGWMINGQWMTEVMCYNELWFQEVGTRRVGVERDGEVRECLLPALGGLLRDPIGSTTYWEINRAVMRFF